MRTPTALVVRTAPHPRSTPLRVAPGQYPLPLRGLAPLAGDPPPAPDEPGRAVSDHEARARQQAARFTVALVEVLSGGRPLRQVATWLAPDVFEQLQRRLDAHAQGAPTRRVQRARLASLHVAHVDTGVLEIAGRMELSGRSRALAVRLEHHVDRRGVRQWRCTALTWA